MAKGSTKIRSLARSYSDNALKVLAEIMNDKSAPAHARALAATELLNRGLGKLKGASQFVLARPTYYVYSVHDNSGRLVYIGKGSSRRHLHSARRLSGKSRVRAEFSNEHSALSFERRLIERFKPASNIVFNGIQNNRKQYAL